MIKCLLSYETSSHHVIYIKPTSSDHLKFDEFKDYLINHYDNLINQLNLNFNLNRFEIYDSDFDQYVVVDKFTEIKNLSKLRVTKSIDYLINRKSSAEFENQLAKIHSCCSTTCSYSTPNQQLINQSINSNQSINLHSQIDKIHQQTLNYSKDQHNHLNHSTKVTPINKSTNSNQSNQNLNGTKNSIESSLNFMDNSSKDKTMDSCFNNTMINIMTSNMSRTITLENSNNSGNISNDSNCKQKFKNEENKLHDLCDKIKQSTPVQLITNQQSIEKQTDQNCIFNTSSKIYQTVQCQTDETDRRIMHLKDNLFKQNCLQLKNDYQQLIEDNKRLNYKIELYKQSSVANATNYLDDFVFNADEIERLKKELDNAKTEQKTVMEAFKKKSNEFRRVVYLLTGFKFDALEQRKYRVSHAYSNLNDYLFFTFEKDEVINLLENKFSEKFVNLINIHLIENGSFPTFLASITMKLFEDKQVNLKKSIIS